MCLCSAKWKKKKKKNSVKLDECLEFWPSVEGTVSAFAASKSASYPLYRYGLSSRSQMVPLKQSLRRQSVAAAVRDSHQYVGYSHNSNCSTNATSLLSLLFLLSHSSSTITTVLFAIRKALIFFPHHFSILLAVEVKAWNGSQLLLREIFLLLFVDATLTHFDL